MSNKILLFIYFVSACRAVLIDSNGKFSKDAAGVDNTKGWQVVKIYHPPNSRSSFKYDSFDYPKYEFEYAVSDKKTGDQKRHHEARDGDKVRGEYSLVEADGSLRKVQYDADDHHGFNAIVSKTFQRHGDHAYSVFGYTRQFLPIGHGIKINHYFPSKDYLYNVPKNTANNILKKEATPVKEIQEEIVTVNDNTKISIPDSEKVMLFEPLKIVEQQAVKKIESPVVKVEPVERTEVKVVPAVVSLIVQNEDENKNETGNITVVPVEEKTDNSENDKAETNEDQKAQAEDRADSEVASSYFSRIYYVGF